MTTAAYEALTGTTPKVKLRPLGMIKGAKVDLAALAALPAKYGVAVYLFFEEEPARNVPLELVIRKYQNVSEDMRPYIRIEGFLQFIQENDPSFAQVMAKNPVMVTIVTVGQIAADPQAPPLVYITGLMPLLDELQV